MSGASLYVLRCADGSFYVGTTRADLERCLAEHNEGQFGGYTVSGRPVRLVFAQHFDQITDAIAAERQIKGWPRAKKEALSRAIGPALHCSGGGGILILRDARLRRAPQDEDARREHP